VLGAAGAAHAEEHDVPAGEALRGLVEHLLHVAPDELGHVRHEHVLAWSGSGFGLGFGFGFGFFGFGLG